MEINIDELVNRAISAREMSYSPYSKFKVGAALLTKNGKIFAGCNIENAAYSPTNCAERTAFFNAVSTGEREFLAIAVVGWADSAKSDEHDNSVEYVDLNENNKKPDSSETGYAFPCGVCRQVMMEFCDYESFVIITANPCGEYRTFTLNQLLPHGFTL